MVSTSHTVLPPGHMARGFWTTCTGARLQVPSFRSSAFLKGRALVQNVQKASPARNGACLLVQAAAAAETTERLRLNNLAPQPGSRRKNLRKGRGYAAGQVCDSVIGIARVAANYGGNTHAS